MTPATSLPYAYLDEFMKACVRKAVLKAVCIPGYQVPYVSEEVPIARGFGSGGLQITLSLIGADDVVKVFDEGDDQTVNAVNLRRFIVDVTSNATTNDPAEATLIQSRHRIPEEGLQLGQILVLQSAFPDALRFFETNEAVARRMHAEADYSKLWLRLYESIVDNHEIMIGGRYPVLINGRYVLDPTHVPRWDLPKLNDCSGIVLFGAGREKRIYAIPPHSRVEPLGFTDHPFRVERFEGAACHLCGSSHSFLTQFWRDDGSPAWVCSDSNWCEKQRATPVQEANA